MAHACEICHAQPSKNNQVLALSEVPHGDDTSAPALHLCAWCVRRREVRAGPAGGQLARAILGGLAANANAPNHRYTYLEDAEAVHLLRLRPDWAHGHEGDRAAAPRDAWNDAVLDFSFG